MGDSKIPALLAVLALCTPPAGAQEADAPLQLAPASDWVVDYAEDSCALRRQFSAGDHRASLQLRQFVPGSAFQVTVASDTLVLTRRPPEVRFDPDQGSFTPSWTMNASFGASANGVMYNHGLFPAELATTPEAARQWPEADRDLRERAITGLQVTRAFERDFLLQTGALHQPMNAMRACMDELLTHWGIDAAAQRTLTRGVSPVDLPAWSRRIQRSYPRQMARQRRSGMIQVRLIVGADGRPTSCGAQADTALPAFEEAACEATMRHARFHPALDAAGAPIASYYTTTIVFMV